MAKKFFKWMFLAGALWNLLGGCAIIVLTDWLFSKYGLNPPQAPAFYYSWIALFVTFGIGYVMIFKDMYANKNLVLLGMIGKLAFAIIFIVNMSVSPGAIPPLFLIPVFGDLIFVVLFGMFLIHARSIQAPAASPGA